MVPNACRGSPINKAPVHNREVEIKININLIDIIMTDLFESHYQRAVFKLVNDVRRDLVLKSHTTV